MGRVGVSGRAIGLGLGRELIWPYSRIRFRRGGRLYLLVQRVQEEAGLVGHRPGPQRRVGGEPDGGVEPIGKRKLVRHGVLRARPRARFWLVQWQCRAGMTSHATRQQQKPKVENRPSPPTLSRDTPSASSTGETPALEREKGVTGIIRMGKSAATPRRKPNVLITGTPGTGKSSLAERVAAAVEGFKRIDVSQLAKEQDMLEEFDEELDTHVIDEDKVLDHMEEHGLGGDAGGVVVDYHGCDLFPERWFDLVVVLTCDNAVLYDRLQARGYSDKKIRGNVECEIFQTLVEEARDSYEESIVKVCASDTIDDMEENEKAIVEFIGAWKSSV